MTRNILLVLADSAEAKAVRRALADAPGGPFEVEWVNRCSDARTRLMRRDGQPIAAVVVDLCLPDSQGLDSFDALFSAAADVPILVLSNLHDEAVARLAVQRGAQDYLLQERLDGYSLPKALANMLGRCSYAQSRSLEREHAQLTLNSIGDGVISTDLAGNVSYLNAVAERMTGWSRQEACGRPLGDVLRLIDGDSRNPSPDPLSMAMVRNEPVGLSANCLLIRRDGHESAIEDTAAPIHDRQGQVAGAVIVFHDVGAARAMSLRMSYLAQHDFLTGLPNRMLLNDRLARATVSAQRYGKELAVLFLDLDHFKDVNDSLGHAIGDQLLRSVADRLATCVRTADTVSRQGGDEFVILLSEVAHARDAAVAADKILAAVSAPHRIGAHEVNVTVSVGIGVYPQDGTDPGTLLQHADQALLRAKTDGRGRQRFFRPEATARAVAPRLVAVR